MVENNSGQGQNKESIFLVDDHAILRTSLRLFLEQKGYRVVGEAHDAHGALEWIPAAMPDVVLLDLTLPDMNGMDLARMLVQRNASVRLIALTMHEEAEYLMPFLQAGGMGYVNKSAAGDELVTAIETVMMDGFYVSQRGAQVIARAHKQNVKSKVELSERELEVLRFVARGFTNREIGQKLFLSVRTVETYRMRLMHKLGLKNRSELVEYAARNRLV